jgi:hypothetical protein
VERTQVEPLKVVQAMGIAHIAPALRSEEEIRAEVRDLAAAVTEVRIQSGRRILGLDLGVVAA